MKRSLGVWVLSLASLSTLSTSGCIVVVGGSWGIGCSPCVWRESTEQLSIDAGGVVGLRVETHNGEVSYQGKTEGATQFAVTAVKRAGGLTIADAEAALEALEVYVGATPDGRKLVAHRWKTPKNPTWRAEVRFSIDGPSHINVDVETHNGEVDVSKVVGEVKVVTHNGEINVESGGGPLFAETHNGEVEVVYAGSEITVLSHNGEIEADLGKCGPLTGKISTHNGSVELAFGEAAAAAIHCETDNGGIKSDVPVVVSSADRNTLKGALGAGGNPLTVRTHNGSIRLKKGG
ncbi:MAG: DUF4097 family beta strand repeat-containing protein [Planctomycetota bacterium]